MYKCRHFSIKELCPPEVVKELGEYKSWWLFDEEGLRTLDDLRDNLGVSLVINDWEWGGQYKYSGFRPPDCDVGAAFSQHRFGRAFDLKVEGKQDRNKSDEVREHIRDNRDLYPWITTLETEISWIHIDGRNMEQFLEFEP